MYGTGENTIRGNGRLESNAIRIVGCYSKIVAGREGWYKKTITSVAHNLLAHGSEVMGDVSARPLAKGDSRKRNVYRLTEKVRAYEVKTRSFRSHRWKARW